MEKHKKKVVTIIGVILIFIAIIAILFSYLFKEDEPSKIKDNPIPNKNVLSKKIERLEDESAFFSIQKIINDFYLSLVNQDTKNLLNVLDTNYIKERNINASNLYTYLRSDYEMVTFVAKNIYYNPNSSVTYYFVNGYLVDLPFLDEDFTYYGNINFVVIVDESTNQYQIEPIQNSVDISDYAKGYDISEREIKHSISFITNSISVENKLSLYMTDFINLLIYDSNRAYTMLSSEAKKKYPTYASFQEQIPSLYSQLSAKIFSYSIKNKEEGKEYYFKDDKQNRITIYENRLMDFQISF